MHQVCTLTHTRRKPFAPDLGPPASTTVRKKTSAIEAAWFVVHCYGNVANYYKEAEEGAPMHSFHAQLGILGLRNRKAIPIG